MLDGNYDMITCKVVIIGESGVGKTCITSRYTKGIFDPNEVPSPSAAFTEKTLILDKNKKIIFDIWDTAGQERFRSISKIFYNDANAVILVYDITNKKSLQEIQKYWYNQILEYSPKDINKYFFLIIFFYYYSHRDCSK